jgi:hypothetical protein
MKIRIILVNGRSIEFENKKYNNLNEYVKNHINTKKGKADWVMFGGDICINMNKIISFEEIK